MQFHASRRGRNRRPGGFARGRCGGVYCPSVLPPKLPSGDTGAGAGGGVIGTIGAGAGFGAGFFATVLFLAGVAVFSPFFLRAGAPRFAFLDFFAFALVFATFNLLIGSTKIMPTTPAARHHLSLCARSLIISIRRHLSRELVHRTDTQTD
jgi:hypothetical protein